MAVGGNYFLLGDQVYELVAAEEPIWCSGRCVAVQFDHEARVLRVCRQLKKMELAAAVAIAMNDACQRLWRPVPVVWPAWEERDRR